MVGERRELESSRLSGEAHYAKTWSGELRMWFRSQDFKESMQNYNSILPQDNRKWIVSCRTRSRCRLINDSHVVIFLAVFGLLTVNSCISSRKPSKVVEDFVSAVGRGEIDRATTLMSSRFLNGQGLDSVKQSLAQSSLELKQDGGIRPLKFPKRMWLVTWPRFWRR